MHSAPLPLGPRAAAVAAAVGLLFVAATILLTSAHLWLAGGPSGVRVPPTAGACFMALGAGFLLVQQEGRSRPRRQARLAGAVVASFALVALCESLLRQPWHLAHIFGGANVDAPASPAWRMSPIAAFEFVLAGTTLALLASGFEARWRIVVVHAAIGVLLGIAFFGLLDPSLRGVRLLEPLGFPALNPAVAGGFFLVGLALMATLECERPSGLLLFEGSGTGHAFRRHLPAALALLAAVNTAVLLAADRGWIAPAIAVCTLVAGNGLVLGAIVGVSARRIVSPVQRLAASLDSGATLQRGATRTPIVSLTAMRRGCEAGVERGIVEKNRHRASDGRAPADGA